MLFQHNLVFAVELHHYVEAFAGDALSEVSATPVVFGLLLHFYLADLVVVVVDLHEVAARHILVLIVAATKHQKLVLTVWHYSWLVAKLPIEVRGAHYINLFPFVNIFLIHFDQHFAHSFVE